MEFQALRLQDEKSDKYWAIRMDGDAFAIFYGKTGTRGRCDVKEFDDEEECRRQAEKQIAAKRKKGYRDYAEFGEGERLYIDHEEYGPHRLTSHPRFVAHFTEEFYYDCADEEAPFGSDEGADTLHELEELLKKSKDADMAEFPRRLVEQIWDLTFYPPDNLEESHVRELLETPVNFLTMEQNLLNSDQVVVATALGQIKIIGEVAPPLRDMALHSLRRIALVDRLTGRGESYSVPTMLKDLESFQNKEL